MVARVVALFCILALLAPAAAAAQGGGAFDPLPPSQPSEPTQAPPPNTGNANDDNGLSDTQQLLIVLSALVLMGGIGYAIVRDARSAAPAEPRRAPGLDEPQRQRGSQKPAGARHRDNRAKAKAARQARKKARKR
jgi:hypothetical protein